MNGGVSVVADTGFYLECSLRSVRDRRYVDRIVRRARQRQWRLHASTLVIAECADHLSHASPDLPLGAWQRSNLVQAFVEFVDWVQIHPPTRAELLQAVTSKRSLASSRRRGEPTLADVVTADLVRQLDPDLIVTTDVRDFRRLLPDFADAILAPADLLKALGATP